MMRGSSIGRRERGSALLIVFVFAAMIAIMLYAELPIAVFESKRQKEQLLIDRGNEYAHGVKLFVRKFGMYPASIDQLENTNRMRFLRHRFKDPFTGKDDWRLLHAGPGGMLIDSKVNPLGQNRAAGGPNQAGTGASSGSSFGSAFGTTATSASANTSSTSTQGGIGSSSQNSSADTVVVPPLPQRPPAISANGAPAANETAAEPAAAAAEGDQSPTTPLLTPAQTDQMAGNPSETQAGQAAATGTQPGQNGQTAPGTAPGQSGGPLNNRPQVTLLPGSTGSTGAPLGQINSGGIAGVASKAKGQSIKTVNDQTDYSLWEFYYDPTKDTTRGAPGQGLSGGQQGVGVNAGAQTQNSFGQNSNTQPTPSSSSTITSSGLGSATNTPTNPPQQ
jgi:hypothetical protein